MQRRFAALSVVLVAVGTHVSISLAEDTPSSTTSDSVVGQEMPFHVVDFANGKHKGHGGCPSVMISNSRGRGLIIWDRGATNQAFQLAKALDAAAVEGQKFQRYIVTFDKHARISDRAADLTHVTAGKARSDRSRVFDGHGVDAESKVLVFLLDQKVIKAAWGLKADEVTDERVKEIVAAATKFAAGEE
jgi:hypothetical protein